MINGGQALTRISGRGSGIGILEKVKKFYYLSPDFMQR